MATDGISWIWNGTSRVCNTRKVLIIEGKHAMREMTAALVEMKSAVAADTKAFSVVHKSVKLARVATGSARGQLELHVAEHGC